MKYKKIYCIILGILCYVGNVLASNIDLSKVKEQIQIAEHKGNLPYCIDVANDVYNSNTLKEFSDNEVYILIAGARAYCFYQDTMHAEILGRYPVNSFFQKYKNIEKKVQLADDNEKQIMIKEFSKDLHHIGKVLLFIEPNTGARMYEIHHRLIENYATIYLNTLDKQDAIDYCGILYNDINWIHAHRESNDIILDTYFPGFLLLINKHKDNPQVYKFLQLTMQDYLPYVLSFSTNGDNFILYAEAITNYILTCQELTLWAKGYSSFRYNNSYYDLDIPVYSVDDVLSSIFNDNMQYNENYTNWNIIKQYLKPNESAALVYSFLDPRSKLSSFFGITFNSKSNKPTQILSLSEIRVNSLEMAPNTSDDGRIYVCYLDGAEDLMSEFRTDIYRKFSLFDIVRERENERVHSHYQNGTVFVCADIDYGEGTGAMPPLLDGKKLISSIKKIFPDQTYILSGKNVRKINFCNIVDDIQIFHVSTHGNVESTLLLDEKSNFNDIVYENQGNDIYLCLSNYNVDPHRYRITATEIQEKLKFPNSCLVFLDACNTNNILKTYVGVNSMAKAFYLAGARNIIAYLNPINEKVATDFAISFYSKLADNPGMTYHNAFYQTKKGIYNKYKDTGLITNHNGKSSLDIVLWE